MSNGLRPVARVGPGAVIGDVCLMGVNIPRAANLTAETQVEAIRIPACGVLFVLSRFPGISSQMVQRLTLVSRQLQTGLPVWSEVIGSLQVFEQCESQFINNLAKECERSVHYFGSVLKEAESEDRSLYVLQHGHCYLEDALRGCVGEAGTGDCFGSGTPVGVLPSEGLSVRVASPVAVLLKLPRNSFVATLARFPTEARRFDMDAKAPSACVLGPLLTRLKIFSTSSPGLLRDLEKVVQTSYYMPRQTLCVEGAVDEANLMVLRGGQAMLSAKNKNTDGVILRAGNWFGELAFIGAVRRRTATIYAQTMCITAEVSRAAFLAVLEAHPKDRQRFEQITMQAMSESNRISWPMLQDTPPELDIMLSLHSERRVYAEGDSSMSALPSSDVAFLVLHGRVVVLDAAGEQVEVLEPGSCINEQVFLGFPATEHLQLLPQQHSEVQIVKRETMDLVRAAFPAQDSKVRQGIIKVMAARVQQRLGYQPGTIGVLVNSSIFRSVSHSLAAELRAGLEDCVFEPGDIITETGSKGDCMHFLLDGVAQSKSMENDSCVELSAGTVIGEAVLLGVTNTYPRTVQALSHCIVQILRRKTWTNVLEGFPSERQGFAVIWEEAERHGYAGLRQRLRMSSRHFIAMACEHASDAFFAKGERIMTCGPSAGGHDHVYVLLAGRARVEDQLSGCLLGELSAGEVVGEMDCVDCQEDRDTVVYAGKQGLVHCVRLRRESVNASIRAFPTEGDLLRDRFRIRQAAFSSALSIRQTWLMFSVLPALRSSPIFARCTNEMLLKIGMGLSTNTFEPGEDIAVAGVPCQSMSFMLDGTAEVWSRDGQIVGQLTKGAPFDEVLVLGLFYMHVATVRAVDGPCTVLPVPASALTEAVRIGQLPGKPAVDMFMELRESRQSQVEQGLPLSALPLRILPGDLAVRAVALHSERLDLPAGEVLMPLVDSSPCGPHFLVLVHGRAIIEITHSGHEAMKVLQGTLLPEGLLADNAARMRATIGCEVYRVRQSEFKVLVSQTTDWLNTFHRLEKEAYSSCRARLKSARAVCQFSRTRSKAVVPQVHVAWDRPPTPSGGAVRRQAGSFNPLIQHQLTLDDVRPSTPQPIPSRRLAKTLPALCLDSNGSKGPLRNFDLPSAVGRCYSSPGRLVSKKSPALRKRRQGSQAKLHESTKCM